MKRHSPALVASVAATAALALPTGALAAGMVITGNSGAASTGVMWTGYAADGAIAHGPASALGIALPVSANHVLVTAGGDFVVVADGTAIRTFPRDVATGAISGGVGFALNPDGLVKGMALAPSGNRVYVVTNDFAISNSIRPYTVGPNGTLSPLTQTAVFGAVLGSPLVSPDGQSLYVMPQGGNPRVIRQYDIGPTGALTPKVTPTVATGDNDLAAPVFTADGHKLVALTTTNTGPEPVTYSIDPGTGALTAPGTFPAGIGSANQSMRVSPNGTFALIASGRALRTLAIGADGMPGALSAPVIVVPAIAGAMEYGMPGFDLSPDGRWAYIAAVTRSNVGSPTPTQPPPMSVPVASDGTFGTPIASDLRNDIAYANLITTPVRPGAAALTASAGAAGDATTFDAGASTSLDAPITSYRWTFGDGSAPVTNASPTVTHTYAAAGTYAATVTVTNSAGCGTNSRFDGMRTVCNGSVGATATVPVTVVAPGAPAPAQDAAGTTPLEPSLPTVCAAAGTTTMRRGRVLARAAVAGRTCAPGPRVRLTLPSAASRRACAITRTGALRGVRAGRCTVRVTTTTDGGTSVTSIVVVVR